MKNLVTTVFKVIVISTLLLCLVGSAANIYLAFNTMSKIDAVAEGMKAELCRNNSILSDSMTGPGGFVTQLADITSTSGGAMAGARGSSNKQYILKQVYVKPADVSMDASNINDYCVLNTNQNAGSFSLTADGAIDTTGWASQGSAVGTYGTFYDIVFVYDVVIDVFSTASAEEIKTGDNDGNNTLGIKGATFKTEQQITYTVPCLRYIK